MKRTLFSLLAVLMVLSLIVAACGPTAEPTTPPEATEAGPAPTPETGGEEPVATEEVEQGPACPSGTITLWHAWKESEQPGLTAVIEGFQAMCPDVQFDVLYVPDTDLRGKYETAAATGGGPTVLIGFADWGPALYDAELVADVSDLVTEQFLRTINPAALGAVTYRDALIGLPQTIKGVVMFRNPSIIADAPATYDDLVTAAQAATAGDIVGADLEYGFFFSAAHLNSVGGLLMDETGNPLFNDEQGVEWVNLLNSFKDAGPTEYYTDNDVNLFKAGQTGIIIDGTWNLTGIVDAVGAENVVIDPWPTPLSGYVQTENIYLNANAEGDDKDAGWAFIEYFMSPEAQALLTEVGHIPAISGVEVDDPHMAQAVAAFADGVAFPVIPEMGAYWGPMDTALKSVFDEGADPAAVLSQAYNSITDAIAEIRGEAPPEPAASAATITLWHAWKESEQPGLTAVIEAFQAKNPDVQFDVLYVPDTDLRGKYETSAATGGGPTVLIGFADWGPALYDAELVADVTEYTSATFLAKINEAAMGAVRYNGAIIGLPQTIKGVVIYRNPSIIADAPATYEDLVAAAQAATQGDIIGADLEYGFFFSAAHLDAIGGQLMDRDGNPMFNDEKGVEWVNLLNSFKDAGPTEYYTDNDVNLFKAGNTGLIIDGTWNLTGIVDAVGAENVVIDPWPTYGDEEGSHLAGYVQTENIYLNYNAEGAERDAGWAFIKFFLSPEAQALLTDVGHIPAVIGTEVTDPLMLQAMDSFIGGVTFPVIPEMGCYWGPMDTALKSVFDEGADAATALQTAYDSITACIDELRGGQ